MTERTISKNVSDAAISLDRISRSLDDVVEMLEEVKDNQQETHSELRELSVHYEKTRKVGFMERLEGLSPKTILLLIGIVSTIVGGSTLSVDNFLEKEPVIQQVEKSDWQNTAFPTPVARD